MEDRIVLPGKGEVSMIAPDFTVMRVDTDTEIWSAVGAAEVRSFCLEAKYENEAQLVFFRFEGAMPSLSSLEERAQPSIDMCEVCPPWKARKVPQPHFCQALRITTPKGYKVVVTQMIATKNQFIVLGRLVWFGFPFLRRWFVGFKPGMRERTEELLLAGIDMLQPVDTLEPRSQ